MVSTPDVESGDLGSTPSGSGGPALSMDRKEVEVRILPRALFLTTSRNMENNCEVHIKVEHKGKMTIYWRCLKPWIQTIFFMDGKKMRVCYDHPFGKEE